MRKNREFHFFVLFIRASCKTSQNVELPIKSDPSDIFLRIAKFSKSRTMRSILKILKIVNVWPSDHKDYPP